MDNSDFHYLVWKEKKRLGRKLTKTELCSIMNTIRDRDINKQRLRKLLGGLVK